MIVTGSTDGLTGAAVAASFGAAVNVLFCAVIIWNAGSVDLTVGSGDEEGTAVGTAVGEAEGRMLGEGEAVDEAEGEAAGTGLLDGAADAAGEAEAEAVGDGVGEDEGLPIGAELGTGAAVGTGEASWAEMVTGKLIKQPAVIENANVKRISFFIIQSPE